MRVSGFIGMAFFKKREKSSFPNMLRSFSRWFSLTIRPVDVEVSPTGGIWPNTRSKR